MNKNRVYEIYSVDSVIPLVMVIASSFGEAIGAASTMYNEFMGLIIIGIRAAKINIVKEYLNSDMPIFDFRKESYYQWKK